MSGVARSAGRPLVGDSNGGALFSTVNSSGPSICISSLVTDTNSALSGGPPLQPSPSINTDPCMQLPTSPMSFASNNVSTSSPVEGSSIVQQSPPQEHAQKKRSPSVTSQTVVPDQGGTATMHSQKKPKIEMKQDDNLQQHIVQPMLNSHKTLNLEGHHKFQAIIREQKMAHIQQQQHQQLLLQQQQRRQQQQQQQHQQQLFQPFSQIPQAQAMQQAPRPQLTQPGVCARRLLQYLFHKRQRPEDNSITYWRKLIGEYFSPRARERWCFSSYERRVNNTLGSDVPTNPASWRCDICSAKAGKGYECTYEIMPRLCQIRFGHGVLDEHLFIDAPREYQTATGFMVLEYTRAIQKSVYETMHVVHEGHLRIVFTPDLKILLWEFCVRRHEELVSRKSIAPQVSEQLQIAQRYQDACFRNGPNGVSSHDAQNMCNTLVGAWRKLAKNLEVPLLNEHGLSKRYVRCLQISEVVNSTKDIMDDCQRNKIGPVEALQNYQKQSMMKFQPPMMVAEGKQPMAGCSNAPADQSNLVRTNFGAPSVGSNANSGLPGTSVFNNSMQTSATLTNYQNLLRNSFHVNDAAAGGPLPHNVVNTINAQNILEHEALRAAYASSNQMQLQDQNAFQQPSTQLVRNLAQMNSGLPLTGLNQQQSSGLNHQLQQHMLRQLPKNNGMSALHQMPTAAQQPPRMLNVNGGFTSPGLVGSGAPGQPGLFGSGAPQQQGLVASSVPQQLPHACTGRSIGAVAPSTVVGIGVGNRVPQQASCMADGGMAMPSSAASGLNGGSFNKGAVGCSTANAVPQQASGMANGGAAMPSLVANGPNGGGSSGGSSNVINSSNIVNNGSSVLSTGSNDLKCSGGNPAAIGDAATSKAEPGMDTSLHDLDQFLGGFSDDELFDLCDGGKRFNWNM